MTMRHAAALLIALVPACALVLRVPGFNGPSYWQWRYLHDSPLPFLACSGVAGGLLLLARRRRSAALLGLTQLFLLVSYTSLRSDPFHRIDWYVRDASTGSFYGEAARLPWFPGGFPRWLGRYPELQPSMQIHAQTHPPGPIIYYYIFVRLAGSHSAVLPAVLVLGFLVCLGAPGLWLLTREITGDPDAAWLAGAAWAVLPGNVVSFPNFDVFYPVFTIGLLYCWLRALRSGLALWAILFGALSFVALLLTHGFLVLGAFFVLSAALALRYRQTTLAVLVRAALLGSLVLGGLFGSLHGIFGYNHWATLAGSVRLRSQISHGWLPRPYRLTIVWDLYDYFLASGWMPLGLLAGGLARWRGSWESLPAGLRVFLPAALAGLLAANFSGQGMGEAARLWMFLQPLVIPLAGAELRDWSPRWQAAAFGVWLLVLAVIRSRLDFVW